ncbi:Uma2 family endonuclease [Oculatella sp. LEGE 06141]|uniref:Uma2 family endonuclease n=1 Tax=Oculatella sp. LEGE 06141 TaxID=1828648 RepID=UPI00188162FD|nr:Uma2 family endonuclease [Oculatella sp. LEGE 06141]MBE9181212.1 Uma2 family endonuclease [Oculatella sp. LEGE 06141]
MFRYDPRLCLPSSAELPDSDDTPVDNELQDLIPGLLKMILAQIWSKRMDWFFGVDMGIYYDPEKSAIVPDGFLSLGVERIVDEELRLSYVLWEEDNIPPILTLEVVSQKYRREYSAKKNLYAEMGVLYYAIYSSRRRRKPRLELYRLVDGEYLLQSGEPFWMPEIGLGLGRERGTHQGITREWLYWYDQQGDRYLTPDERAEQAEQRAEQAQQQAEQAQQQAEQERQLREELLAKLRQRGIDPDSL